MAEEIKYNFKEKLVIYSVASIVGILVIMLSVLLAAAVCLATDASDSYSTLISGICLGLGSLVCGYLSSKKIGRAGLINGALSGLVICLVVFVVSLFISGNSFTLVGISHLLIVLITAAIGGILGVNFSKKKRII